MTVLYRIDRDDQIVETGGDWEGFAVSNGGVATVVGERLWQFIAGDDVRSVWSVLLRRARTSRAPLTFSYRCDAPGLRRIMEMELRANGAGAVAFASRTLEETPGQVLGGPWASETDPPLIVVCGWCGRARDGHWREPHEVITLYADRLPKLSHGICDECVKKFSAR